MLKLRKKGGLQKRWGKDEQQGDKMRKMTRQSDNKMKTA